jgi:hypothetical protein
MMLYSSIMYRYRTSNSKRRKPAVLSLSKVNANLFRV